VNIVVCALTAVAAYLLGSIPTGFLVGKAKGIDVRKVGSGNIGATNAFRILGKGPGIFVLVADGLKGWVAVDKIPDLVHAGFDSAAIWDQPTLQWLKIIAAISVILGHNYTCWLKFKGGKGIATSAGVLAALVPVAMVVSLATWIIVCVITRYVSMASIAASLILPFATWAVPQYGWNLVLITAAMAALAIYKHKANITRLMNGTENRLGQKKVPPAAGATL
jgi:glycerol-3-phosphate acyltransferase PlsY